jgi:hypothetical protein
MNESRPLATLEPLRFGEFLRDRKLIDDEQWLAALADHWSAPRHRRIGDTIVARGLLSADQVEAEARAFHEELHVIELDDRMGLVVEAGEADEAGQAGQAGQAGEPPEDMGAVDMADEEPTGEVGSMESEVITTPVQRVGLDPG